MAVKKKSNVETKNSMKSKHKLESIKKTKKCKSQILIQRKNEVFIKKTKKKVLKNQKKKDKRKQYSSDDVQKALDAVNKGLSYREAAKKFGVPATSIHRALQHPEKLNSRHGPAPILSTEVEKEIIHWILYRAERGYPVSKTELLDSVQAYIRRLKIQTPFTNDRPGRHWYENFRQRHQQITLRTPQHLTHIRAQVSEDDLRGWFEEVKAYLVKNNLFNIHPSRVFNCDETNIQLIPKSEKILTRKGATTAYKVVHGYEKESITALFMYAADGTRAPPMIMYKYKDSVPISVLKNCPVGWGIGNSETGWMTTETFYEYITNIFYPWLISKEIEFPVVLYLDGHSSHVTIPLVSFCREKKLEIIALYPNATHVMQPLDIAFFHPFKDLWKKGIIKWKAEENISILRKEHIPSVLKKTLDSFSHEKRTVQNGFRASGLMPFNADAVEYNVLHKKKKKKSKNKEQKQQECQQPQSNSEHESRMQHLMAFEQNLSDSLLQAFKEAETSGIWNSDIENIGLFNYWLKIKKASSENANVQPRAVDDECLNNHNVIVIPHFVPESVNDGLLDVMNSSDSRVVIEIDENIEASEVEDLVRNNSTNEYISSTLETGFTNDNIINQNISLNQLEMVAPEDLCNDQKENLPNNTVIITATENSYPTPEHQRERIQLQIRATDSNEKHHSNEKNDCSNNSDSLPLNRHENNVENVIDLSTRSHKSEIKPPFADALILPEEYLPKNKKMKLRGSRKPRLPCVGTSDEWWKIHKEKEEAEKAKQEKLAKKKALQEEKNKLAKEKKSLEQKLKTIQQEIKSSQIKIKKEKI